ncbi:MAG: hypothetical protein WCO04_04320 [Pseudomonadota bacterium]
MRDIYSSLDDRIALQPAAQTAAFTGTSIDLFGCRSAIFAVATGALVGSAIFGAKLQESADSSTWTDVGTAEVQSDAPATLVANASYRLGYLGSKRYARLAGVYTSGTSLVIGAVALVEVNKRPVA